MNAPLIILVAVPLAIPLVNATLNRTARLWTSPPSPRVTPFAAGALMNAAAVPLFLLARIQSGSDISDTIFGFLYVVSYVNLLVLVNWFVFAVSEFSMHVHLLVEIRRQGVIPPESLRAHYNKSAILSARVLRLLELGLLRLDEGRLFYVKSPATTAVRLEAQLILALRRILGIPSGLEDAQDSAPAG